MNIQIKKPYRTKIKNRSIINKNRTKNSSKLLTALVSIQKWLSFEFKPCETLPKEFRDFFPVSQDDHFKHHWHRYL